MSQEEFQAVMQLAQKMTGYRFIPPSYENIVDDAIAFLQAIKTDKQYEESPYFHAYRSLFWDLIMEVARQNNFTKK